MDFDTKAAHRKSRAPWQMNGGSKINNPYANASNMTNGNLMNQTQSQNSDSLQVPNPYGGSKANNNKRTRRLSIHASASAAAHTKNMIDAANLPPVPNLPDIQKYKVEPEDSDPINSKIMQELSNGTAVEINDYFKVLTKQQAIVTRDLKSNINENQKNILELMTDLKQTQDELLQLRITTKDLYGVLDEFRDSAERRLDLELKHDDKSPYNQSVRRNNKKDRSSIMILEKMWVTELQSLFKHVEGASKFVQSIPGRHVLAESGRWFEVNMGNWKATKAIHIFVLNDLILVATKNSNTTSNKSKLQAVHCWSLHDTQLQVISKDNDKEKGYMIKIDTKSLGFIYQTDRYDHFVKITEAYNKGKNELLQKDRLVDARKSINGDDGFDSDDEKRQLRRSFRNSGAFEDDVSFKRRSGSKRHSQDILLQDISARVHSRNRSNDFSASGKFSTFDKNDKGQFFNELKRIEDRLDEVDIQIAHNNFNETVGLINYIENKISNIETILSKTSNTDDEETLASLDEIKLLIDVVKLKISNRILQVQQSLTFNLKHNISKIKTQELGDILEYFYNFGVLDKGITAFLQAVSNDLSAIVSKLIITVQGSTKTDVGNYLSNLVIINVSIMKKTVLIYKECIFPLLERDNKGNVDSSGLINWCIEEGNKLVVSIKKQLFGTLANYEDPDDETNTKLIIKDDYLFQSFLNVLKPQLNELKTVGVNIDYLFDDLLNASK